MARIVIVAALAFAAYSVLVFTASAIDTVRIASKGGCSLDLPIVAMDEDDMNAWRRVCKGRKS